MASSSRAALLCTVRHPSLPPHVLSSASSRAMASFSIRTSVCDSCHNTAGLGGARYRARRKSRGGDEVEPRRTYGWVGLAVEQSTCASSANAIGGMVSIEQLRRALSPARYPARRPRPPPCPVRLTASPTHFLNAANSSAHIPFSTSVYLAPMHLPYAAPCVSSERGGKRGGQPRLAVGKVTRSGLRWRGTDGRGA